MTSDPIRAGILGGGQLARMLAAAAPPLRIEPHVFTEHADDPAAEFAARVHTGSQRSVDDLRSFLSSVDVVVFENEFADVALLRDAATGLRVRFAPRLEAMAALQDKLQQKSLLAKLGARTADWIAPREQESPAEFVTRALGRWRGRAVFKTARGGYDGRGVFVAGQADAMAAAQFVQHAARSGARPFAEEPVAVRSELAVVTSRAGRGRSVVYPVVEFTAQRGICHLVRGPAEVVGIAPDLCRMATALAMRLGDLLDLAGTFAIELFVDESGAMLVNEVAPRVHNSGHFSLDACEASQFENHWRGVLGLELAAPMPQAAFAMLNLIGPAGIDCDAGSEAVPVSGENAHVHWYGKRRVRPGRKVGHVNAAVTDARELPRAVQSLGRIEREWHAALRKRCGGEKESA